MRPAFMMFGPAHLAMLVLAALAPLLLAFAARCRPSLDRPIRFGLAALLLGGWIAWYLLFWSRGWLSLNNGLPLNLCDWAAVILILALITKRQFAYELGYFWGLGGSLQGLITPDIAYDFRDPQFIFFAIKPRRHHHRAALSHLHRHAAPRRQLAKGGGGDLSLCPGRGHRGFSASHQLRFPCRQAVQRQCDGFSFALAWYIPELVGIGLLSLLIYYTPFLLWRRRVKRAATDRPPHPCGCQARVFHPPEPVPA